MDGVMDFLYEMYGDEMPSKKLQRLYNKYDYERNPSYKVSEIKFII